MSIIKIVGLGGSMVTPSSSLSALNLALEGAAGAGAETELLDLRAMQLPMYVPDADPNDAVRHMCDAVYEADGMLWSSPLYHGTISGAFKNALDWLQLLGNRKPAFLTDKVIGLISTAGGTHGLQAVNTMEFVVRALRGWAVPLVIPIPEAWRVFDKEGRSVDPKVADQLQALGREVTRAAKQFASKEMTTAEAARVEAQLEPLGKDEIAL
jgi:FMN reductase